MKPECIHLCSVPDAFHGAETESSKGWMTDHAVVIAGGK
jgi:hypothetical protein